jgi:urease accessory protein
MPRAIRVIRGPDRERRPLADTVLLNYAQRSAQRVSVCGVKGGSYEIALHEPMRLRTDDVLELDNGHVLEVVAAAEQVLEARLTDVSALARLAWQLGDRHVPVQILANRIRVRREPAVEALLSSLGAKMTMIEAPFEPEGGAYESSPHAHRHRHAHPHDH